MKVRITVGSHPTDQTTASGAATFTVAATCDNSGTVTFQWQRRTSSSARWTNVSGATSASLALTGLTNAADGYQYRVKLNADVGAPEVISSTATLTFGT